MMKKIHFLLLISLLLAACSDDDKEKQPAFVTNITISDAGKTFNPGDWTFFSYFSSLSTLISII